MSKYKKKYAKQLINGLRRTGKSVAEICQLWGITRKTYHYWVQTQPEFAEAHEVGETDDLAYWEKFNREFCTGQVDGNAGQLKFTLANKFGWTDKVQTQVSTNDTEIKTITINVLPTKQEKELLVIEHDDES